MTEPQRRERFVWAPAWLVKWVLAVGLLGLPLLQVLCVLFYEETLSSSVGIEYAIAGTVPPRDTFSIRRTIVG